MGNNDDKLNPEKQEEQEIEKENEQQEQQEINEDIDENPVEPNENSLDDKELTDNSGDTSASIDENDKKEPFYKIKELL